ncbi:MAG: DUF72 domain-containing protein [Cyclobacteriaceae bacterium]|nr:DUF72 domain-containing protein [Cyclobacteriaceae bacterium]
MEVYIGCSGFYYRDWKNDFYPDDLQKKNWLSFYAENFNSVEINNSFYRIPDRKDLKNWAEKTPAHFRFVFKGYQFITHRKKLNVDQALVRSLHDFYEGLSVIEHKTAGILWQFPSNFPYDFRRIEKFSTHLKKEIPNFFEFRNPVWFKKEVFDFIDHLGLGFCTVSAPGLAYQDVFPSSQWIYLRLHGADKWYDYMYEEKELKEFRDRILEIKPDQAFVFFNNDVGAQAPKNAGELVEMFRKS